MKSLTRDIKEIRVLRNPQNPAHLDEILCCWALLNGSLWKKVISTLHGHFQDSTGNSVGPPPIFDFNVNDLPDRSHSEVELFADDALWYGVIVNDTD